MAGKAKMQRLSYRNENGIIKYECKNCKAVSVRKQKGRRHDTIDLYAPAGQVRYE